MPFTVKRKKSANASLSFLHDFTPKGKTYDWETNIPFQYRGGIKLAKQSKKDGGTKQKGKNKPNQKTSGSANGQNGYH